MKHKSSDSDNKDFLGGGSSSLNLSDEFEEEEEGKRYGFALVLWVILGLATVSAAVVATLISTGVINFKETVSKPVGPVYPAYSADPNASKIDDGSSVASKIKDGSEGGGGITMEYSREVKSQKGNTVAVMKYKNPSSSVNKVRIQLQIYDSVLLNTVGKTGRMGDNKKLIEEAEGYDPATSRVTIGETGSVDPGYAIETIKLCALEDGTVIPKGTYDAVFHILPYDMETNELEVVDVNIPVTLTILE